MSVTTTRRPAPPTWTETLEETAADVGAPAIYGPPVSFLFGPWLLLMLLLIPPFALLFTIVLVLAVGAGLLAAAGALLASPYLLVRRLHAHPAPAAKPQAAKRPARGHRFSSFRVGSPQAKGAS
jgi:hypothetical protein